MIRCSACGTLSRRGEQTFPHVVQTRLKEYDNGGKGFETVKEVRICVDCHKKAEALLKEEKP